MVPLVAAAACREVAEDPEEVASAVEASAVEASVVEAEVAEEEAPVEASDDRQFLSCLVLSYYGVMGKRELLQEPFCRDIHYAYESLLLQCPHGCKMDTA